MESRRLRSLIVEGGLATAPLVMALIALVFGWTIGSVVAVLVVITCGCAVGLLVVELAKAWKLESLARLMFVGGFVVWYAYPAVISELVPGYGPEGEISAESNPEIKVWALVCMSSFLLCGVLTMIVLRRGKRGTKELAKREGRPVDLVLSWASVACFTGMATYLVLGEGLEAVVSAIFEGRSGGKPWMQQEILGDAVSALSYITSSAMVGGAALAWIAMGDKSRKRWKRIGIGLLAGLVSMVLYFDHGTRSLLLLVVGPALALWWAARFQRSKTGSLAVLAVLAPVMFVVLQVQMLYRTETTRTYIGELLFDRWLTLGGTIDFFRETLIALELVPAYHGYFRESVVMQFLISPIPRFMWPGKPSSEMVWFYTMQRWNVDIYVSGGNVLPGVIGQFYMSWGMIGPALAGALLGLIVVGLERWLAGAGGRGDRVSLGVAAMVCLWVFVSFRQLSPGFAYPVLAAMGIVWLGRRRSEVRDHSKLLTVKRGSNADWTESSATGAR
jgi:oligosaccharide repeat unit polymerase